MCGRYQIDKAREVEELLAALFQLKVAIGLRFNVCPMQTMLTVASQEDGAPRAAGMRWGFVPYWDQSDIPKISPINARSEGVLTTRMFRQAVQRRRCAVPATGFYEWHRIDQKTKIPYLFRLRGSRPFFFAGIFEGASDKHPESFAMLTTGPNALMTPIHDRLPVILDDDAARRWIAPGPLESEALAEFSTPYPAGEMEAFEVSRLVNNPRNDSPEVAEPVG